MKMQTRHAIVVLMEFILKDKEYQECFIYLSISESHKISEFCCEIIADLNTLIFEGLLTLEEIKVYEETASNSIFQSTLDED